MAVLHISEAELARNVQSVLDQVQAGAEIIIERNAKPLAVLRAMEPRRRKLSEIAASLPIESAAILDKDFAADVQSFIDHHLQANGIRVALADLPIGTTALELGYAVATHNVRHFQLIPGLTVRQI